MTRTSDEFVDLILHTLSEVHGDLTKDDFVHLIPAIRAAYDSEGQITFDHLLKMAYDADVDPNWRIKHYPQLEDIFCRSF